MFTFNKQITLQPVTTFWEWISFWLVVNIVNNSPSFEVHLVLHLMKSPRSSTKKFTFLWKILRTSAFFQMHQELQAPTPSFTNTAKGHPKSSDRSTIPRGQPKLLLITPRHVPLSSIWCRIYLRIVSSHAPSDPLCARSPLSYPFLPPLMYPNTSPSRPSPDVPQFPRSPSNLPCTSRPVAALPIHNKLYTAGSVVSGTLTWPEF